MQHFPQNCGELPKDLQRVEALVSDIVPIAQLVQSALASSMNPLLHEPTLIPLLAGCRRKINEYLQLLESLKITTQSWWRSFLTALKTIRKAGQIRNIEEALNSYKTSMTLRLADASLARRYVQCVHTSTIAVVIQGTRLRIGEPDPTASEPNEIWFRNEEGGILSRQCCR